MKWMRHSVDIRLVTSSMRKSENFSRRSAGLRAKEELRSETMYPFCQDSRQTETLFTCPFSESPHRTSSRRLLNTVASMQENYTWCMAIISFSMAAWLFLLQSGVDMITALVPLGFFAVFACQCARRTTGWTSSTGSPAELKNFSIADAAVCGCFLLTRSIVTSCRFEVLSKIRTLSCLFDEAPWYPRSQTTSCRAGNTCG